MSDAGRLREAEAEIARLRADVGRYRMALESLTPGGSEFSGDPFACSRHVQQRLSSVAKLKMERDRLQERLYLLADAAGCGEIADADS